jgi:long-chain fatty acid transport protein
MKQSKWAWPAICALGCVLGWPVALQAQLAAPDVTVTPKPVGSGARALAQSAFIAVADDATAASWNPAGLIQLEAAELSVVGAWLYSVNHFTSYASSLHFDRETWDQPELNFMSVAVPFTVFGKDVVVSLNYHQVYDFGLDTAFTQGIEGANLPVRVRVESEGGVAATSLAAGISLTPSLTFGAAVNVYHNALLNSRDAWEVKTRGSASGTLGPLPVSFGFENTETFDDFEACNVTLGLLWDVWEKNEKRLTAGFVCHTPYTADVDRRTDARTWLNGEFSRETFRERFEIDFPLSLGAGVNFRFCDEFSAACDVQWTDWSEFEQESRSGERTSPIGGGEPGRVSDTVAVRLGCEYLIPLKRSVLALRAGVFYDPRPALDDPMDIYGCSAGFGLSNNRCSLDFAYQFRYGEDVNGSNLGLSSESKYHVEEHWFVASVIFYF